MRSRPRRPHSEIGVDSLSALEVDTVRPDGHDSDPEPEHDTSPLQDVAYSPGNGYRITGEGAHIPVDDGDAGPGMPLSVGHRPQGERELDTTGASAPTITASIAPRSASATRRASMKSPMGRVGMVCSTTPGTSSPRTVDPTFRLAMS